MDMSMIPHLLCVNLPGDDRREGVMFEQVVGDTWVTPFQPE